MDLGIAGKVALVGGGSSGLGLAIAHELAAAGCAVALVARGEGALQEAARAVHARHGVPAVPVVADLSRAGAGAGAVARAVDALGAVEILVANAGGPKATSVAEATLDDYHAALQTNLLASVELARAVLPGMTARGWGRILFVSSFAAKEPQPGLLLSNTARAGLLGFAKTLAREVAPQGVTVNTLLPGHFDTARALELARMRAERSGQPLESLLRARTAGIPTGRPGDAAEFAAVAAFLASTRASFVTGTALAVDGGQTAALL